MEVIQLNDVSVHVVRKKIKNMNISIRPPLGDARVSAPQRMPISIIQKFVESKEDWIRKHRERIQALDQMPKSQPITKEEKAELFRTASELIHLWSIKMNFKLRHFRIRDMKTRWGTYSTRTKTVTINLQLAKKSIDCLEYLIIHELVHAFVPGHGKDFKNMMDHYLPDWRSLRRKLRKERS